MIAFGLVQALTLLMAASGVAGKVYFKETFDDDNWKKRWTTSRARPDYGDWRVNHGEFYADKGGSRALQTAQDNRFYMISAPFKDTHDSSKKPLVVQYSVKFEQNDGNSIFCGGGYLKLYPPGLHGASVDGESTYNIMFGPDLCGGDKKTQVILHYNGDNKPIRRMITPASDMMTHMYTLAIYPNGTYLAMVDNKQEATGTLLDDWELLPPKKIPDPTKKKPADWVDKKMMDDVNDSKPAGYDQIPELISDPEATKPEDYDEDVEGEWVAPMVPNPAYKGPWRPRQIPNPKYKGPWVQPLIDNPEYFDDGAAGHYSTARIGFDLWQVKSGTMFDDIIVTDSMEEAEAFAAANWGVKAPLEKAHKDKQDKEKKRAQDREARERRRSRRKGKKGKKGKGKRRPQDEEDDSEDESEEEDDEEFEEEMFEDL